MPDVLNYQQEMRKDAKNKGRERTADRSRDIEVSSRGKRRSSDVYSGLSSGEDEKTKKKPRVSFGSGKRTKAGSSADGESEIESPPASKKRHIASDDEEVYTGGHRKPAPKTPGQCIC